MSYKLFLPIISSPLAATEPSFESVSLSLSRINVLRVHRLARRLRMDLYALSHEQQEQTATLPSTEVQAAFMNLEEVFSAEVTDEQTCSQIWAQSVSRTVRSPSASSPLDSGRQEQKCDE